MSVGVVTSIETDSGTVNTSDIDEDMRREWAETLASKLSKEDGVQSACVSSLAKFTNNQVGSIEVVLSTEDNRVIGNPRSVSPRIRTIIDEYTPVSSFEVTRTPTAIDAENNQYDSNYYIIDIYFF